MKRGRPTTWTLEMLAYLRQFSRLKKTAELAAELNRSKCAVRNKCHELGIRATFKWTPAAIAKLRSLAGTMSMHEIAVALGCTKKAVASRMQSLGISNRSTGRWRRTIQPKAKLSREQRAQIAREGAEEFYRRKRAQQSLRIMRMVYLATRIAWARRMERKVAQWR